MSNPFSYEDHASRSGPTPKPSPVRDLDQDLVLRIANSLHRSDANAAKIAVDLVKQEPQVQRNLAVIISEILGLWAELDEFASPTNPLANEYRLARRMVSNLFE